MKDELIYEIQTKFPDLIEAILETMEHTQYDGWGWTLERLIEENPPLFRALVENYRDNVRTQTLTQRIHSLFNSTPDHLRNVQSDL